MANQVISDICIPRMETSISYRFIQQTLIKMNIGKIRKIVEIPLKNEKDYKRVLITLQWHNFNPRSQIVHQRLEEGKNVKIVYDNPWYWKMVMGRPNKLHIQ
jgi:hypothetical protein